MWKLIASLIVVVLLIGYWHHKVFAFTFASRKLWTDHVLWTREYMNAVATKRESKFVLERLLKNQDDLGQLYGRVYGSDHGILIRLLLREHIQVATRVIAGDTTATPIWYANGDRLADALGCDRAMMKEHLDLTAAEWSSTNSNTVSYNNISVFDTILGSILDMSDAISRRISYTTLAVLYS